VQVHGASRQALEGLGHERGAGAGRAGQGAHGVFQPEGVVGRSERVCVVDVDLQLAWPVLAGDRLDRDVAGQPVQDLGE
jgi:hypothetical protein